MGGGEDYICFWYMLSKQQITDTQPATPSLEQRRSSEGTVPLKGISEVQKQRGVRWHSNFSCVLLTNNSLLRAVPTQTGPVHPLVEMAAAPLTPM